MVQRHAARYVLNIHSRHASVSEMICILAWMAHFREQAQYPKNCYEVQNYEQLGRLDVA